jgi:hypothetical protein
MKKPVMEIMVKMKLTPLVVRVWWTDDNSQRSRIESIIAKAFDVTRGADLRERAKGIAHASPQIAAIELLDADGQGVVFYQDWN